MGIEEICLGDRQSGELCSGSLDQNDADCAGSLKCAQRAWNDATYICCDDTYLDGFVEKCAAGIGDTCDANLPANDDSCYGSSVCAQRSGSDSTYICCAGAGLDAWSNEVCLTNGGLGEECYGDLQANDADCAGSLKCAQRAWNDATYICCDYTYLDGFVEKCASANGETCDEWLPANDDSCKYDICSNVCAKRSTSDETYICCCSSYVPFLWTSEVCNPGSYFEY